MIAGIFHQGSGLGDQLHRYITLRTLAEEKGYEWGMLGDENWKGGFFEEWPWGVPEGIKPELNKQWNEKGVYENGIDIRSYDPEINFVADNTIIDGSFEDFKYWGHNLDNISKWLAVEPLNVPDNTCVVGFRGGEYASVPELYLHTDYYQQAIEEILEKNNVVTFEVHSDDPVTAKNYFNGPSWVRKPQFAYIDNHPISHSKHTNMGFNWRSARYAKYAIIPNSAFFILPRLLKHHEDPTAVTIAPRYWARRNTKTWARPACYYKQFKYI